MRMQRDATVRRVVRQGPRLGADQKRNLRAKAKTALPVMHVSAMAQGLISNQKPWCICKSSPKYQSVDGSA